MLVVVLAVLAGATLQSTLGFGFALVVSPALLLVLSPPQTLTVLLLLGPPVNLIIALGERRRRWHVQTRLLSVLLLAAVPGIAAGALLLPLLGRRPLQVVVGVVVLVAVGQQARAPSSAEAARKVPTAATTAAVGLATGLLTTSTGTNGPPMVLWFSRLRLPAAQQRDTLFAAFSALGLVGLGALLLSGSFDPSGVGVGGLLLLVVLALVGRAAGWVLFRRLAPERFRFAGLLLVAALGVVSLASGLLG